MKKLFLLIIVFVSVVACAHLPEIHPPLDTSGLSAETYCGDPFPRGRWQLYHAIQATAPGGRKSVLTGVSVLSSRDRSIDCALMTPEGLVLFNGHYNGILTVDRAIPPFDRPGFAQGLMDDLMLLFFAPRASLCQLGQLDRSNRICRFCSPNGTTDIVVKENRGWEVRQYSGQNRLTRSVVADNVVHIAGGTFPERMTLRNHGMLGYQLELKLLEAIPLNTESGKK